jgi:hypothetical protein
MSKKEVKFIHVFDDEKFVNHAIAIFNSLDNVTSEYYVIKDNENTPFKHTNPALIKKNIISTDSGFQEFINTLEKENDNIVLLIHALSTRKQEIIKRLNTQVLLVWFIWGVDLYNVWKPLKYKIFEKETFKFVFRNYTFSSIVINCLFFKYNLYKVLKKQSKIFKSLYYTTTQKIDVVVPVLPTEMKYLLNLNKNFIYAPFTYGSLELLLGSLINESAVGARNILVGNSSTAANNHIEAFKKLSKINLGDRKVIVPLSYGDKGEYLDFVIKNGKKYLGDNFYPITDFMPLDQYNALILSCGTAIFNHIRQQSVGNIIVMAYFGSRLFFNEKGVAYKYYKSQGLKINTLNEFNETLLNTQVNEVDYIFNKEQMKALYSQEAVENKVRKLADILLSHPIIRE